MEGWDGGIWCRNGNDIDPGVLVNVEQCFAGVICEDLANGTSVQQPLMHATRGRTNVSQRTRLASASTRSVE